MNERANQVADMAMAWCAPYGMNVLGAIATLIFNVLVAGWLARLRRGRWSARRRSTRSSIPSRARSSASR